MRAGTIAFGIAIVVVSMVVVVWTLKTESPEKSRNMTPAKDVSGPEVSPTPPYPKAIAPESRSRGRAVTRDLKDR